MLLSGKAFNAPRIQDKAYASTSTTINKISQIIESIRICRKAERALLRLGKTDLRATLAIEAKAKFQEETQTPNNTTEAA